LCPNHAPALNNLATLREQQRRWDEAKQLYNRAIQADPNLTLAIAGLGDVLYEQKDYRQAAEMFDKFLTKASRDPALQPYVQRYTQRLEKALDNITVSATEIETALALKRSFGPPKVDVQIHFATNSATVAGKALDKCQKMAEVIKRVLRKEGLEQSLIRIEGHTDSRGRAAYNEGLSKRRAESVKDELVKNGVPAYRLEVLGWGEWKPLTSNKTPLGRFKNRRVTLVRID
jgi:outer membrane protein OmpA-like peptidoglycan-associated protein